MASSHPHHPVFNQVSTHRSNRVISIEIPDNFGIDPADVGVN